MKYASVYKRESVSPHFYITYWSVPQQKRISEATPFRLDDPMGRRKALDLAYAKSKEAIADRAAGGADRWDNWTEDFIRARYRGRTKTLDRMLYAWKQWHAFFDDERLRVPRALDYNAVLKFIRWRSSQVKPSSGKRVSKNTALCDVRVMSCIMREALRRGYATTNHCEKLGIQKDPARQKPEMTDEEIAQIRQALATRPEWMRTAFEIAIHQGCRLTETSVPLHLVDLQRQTIAFSAKGRGGGIKHVFTTQLHPALRPMMETLKASGSERTCTLPVMASKEWHMFFREVKLRHLCFHCTRVTVITRMARAGVPISQAMAFVGHASETIHRIYQRLATGDLNRAVAALSYADDAKPQTPGANQTISAPSAPW